MERVRLTDYDFSYPRAMVQYLRHNGPHFNKKLLEFAQNKMFKLEGNKRVKIDFLSKEHIDKLLQMHKISLENNVLYDYLYVASMCQADFLGSSISDEKHMCLYIKDVIDDPDASDGYIFNRWYADMCYFGIPIDWEEML